MGIRRGGPEGRRSSRGTGGRADTRFETFYVVISWTALAAVVGGFAWGANRGFDFSDESYSLLSFRFPRAAPPDTRQFQFIVDALTLGQSLSIAGYRMLGLAVLLAGSSALTYAFVTFIDRRLGHLTASMPPKASLYSSAATANLLGLTWLPRTVSYNFLATALGELAVAAVLLATSSPRLAVWESRRRSALLASAAGLLLVLLFYTKFSAALPVSALVVAFLLAVGGLRRGLVLAAALAGGAMFSVLLLTTDYLGGPFSLEGLRGSISIAARDSHDPGSLLGYYTREALWVGRYTLISIPAVLMAVTFSAPVIVRLLPRRFANTIGWAIALPGPLAIGTTWYVRWRGNPMASFRVVYMIFSGIVLGLALAAIAARQYRRRAAASQTGEARMSSGARPSRRKAQPVANAERDGSQHVTIASLVLLLLALPFALSFGTNNSIFRHAIISGAAFACLVALAWSARAAMLEANRRETMVEYIPLVFSAVAFAALVLLGGGLMKLFGVSSSTLDQTEMVVGLRGLSGVYVDPTTARVLTQVQNAADAAGVFRPGDPVVADVGLMGSAYAIGGWLPGTQFYSNGEVTCRFLERVPDDLVRTDLVIRFNRKVGGDLPGLEPQGGEVFSDFRRQIDEFELPMNMPWGEATITLDECLRKVLPGYPAEFDLISRIDGWGWGAVEVLVRGHT